MKRAENLKDFSHKNIILLVTGKQDAAIYHINYGNLEEVERVVVKRPHYSDNEGIFQAAPGGRHVSGSVELRQDEVVIQEFIHELLARIKTIKFSFEEIYYFAPDMSRNRVREALPKAWQEKIVYEKAGNYYKEQPFDVLARIEDENENTFEPTSIEEKKILSIPEQS